MLEADDILKKIKAKEGFCAGKDFELTEMIKKEIEKENKIVELGVEVRPITNDSVKNEKTIENLDSLQHINIQLQQIVMDNINFNSTDWNKYNISMMEDCKNITSKTVSGTRFKWIKKIIMRLMKPSTAWQELYNENALELFKRMSEKISKLESVNELLIQIMNNNIQQMSEFIKNNEILLQQIKEGTTKTDYLEFNKNISIQLDEEKKRVEEIISGIINNQIKEVSYKCKKIDERIEILENYTNMTQKYVNLLSDSILTEKKMLEILCKQENGDK